jgi:outer membrane lipoprotein SlyB
MPHVESNDLDVSIAVIARNAAQPRDVAIQSRTYGSVVHLRRVWIAASHHGTVAPAEAGAAGGMDRPYTASNGPGLRRGDANTEDGGASWN